MRATADYCRPAQHHALLRRTACAFPSMCAGNIEDAVADAYLALVEQPELLAWAQGADREQLVRALLRTIAWRRARGRWRRAASRRECAVSDDEMEPESGAGEGPDVTVEEVDQLIVLASQRWGQRRGSALRLALHERIFDGATDSDVAHRHHFSRDILRQARKWMADRLTE